MNPVLKQKLSLLAVGREAAVLRLLHSLAESHAWRVEAAASGWDAVERVQSGYVPELLLLDLARGDAESLHFLRWLRRTHVDLPVVLLCYPDDAMQGREALQSGAGEMLVRPFESKQLERAIQRQMAPAEDMEAEMVTKNVEALSPDALFVSASLITQKLRAQATLLAKSDVPVLIVGERGAGKFTCASLIHSLSVRSGFKLRRLNCAEMPESLLAAELFGDPARREEGRRSPEKARAGEKDTVFLDEITALPPALQPRLLQLLVDEDGRDAAAESISAKVRILAGSSASLDRALAEKRLREDLYYRLSAFTIQVPPLRQRKDEIPVLLCYFMHKLAKYYSLPPRGFSAAAIEACQLYSWPGNLKEMETFVKRYLVAGDADLFVAETDRAASPAHASQLPRAHAGLGVAALVRKSEDRDRQPESLKSLIQEVKSEAEQSAITAALQRTGWNRKAAARLLRVSYRTLLYKIEQYNMRAPAPFFSALPGEKFLEYEEVKGNGKAS